MTDAYQPPQSDVAPHAASSGQYGSIEKALNGDYEFGVIDAIKEGWDKTNGAKGIIIGGFLIMYAVSFVVTLVVSLVAVALAAIDSSGILSMVLMQTAVIAATYPFVAGVMMVGIRKSVDQPISFSMIFDYFGQFGRIFITAAIMTVLVVIGTFLLVIPGIYLAIAYALAIPLVVEKNMSPWEALETSRKAITKQWFKVFGLLILLWLILAGSALLLLVPLVWTAPAAIIAIGILYRNMFGVEAIS